MNRVIESSYEQSSENDRKNLNISPPELTKRNNSSGTKLTPNQKHPLSSFTTHILMEFKKGQRHLKIYGRY